MNYPGIIMTDGEQLTGKMRQQAENFGAEFLSAEVTGLDLDGDYKTVHTDRGDFKAPGIIYAAGAHPRLAGFEGKVNSEDTVWHTARPATENFSPARIFCCRRRLCGGRRRTFPHPVWKEDHDGRQARLLLH